MAEAVFDDCPGVERWHTNRSHPRGGAGTANAGHANGDRTKRPAASGDEEARRECASEVWPSATRYARKTVHAGRSTSGRAREKSNPATGGSRDQGGAG